MGDVEATQNPIENMGANRSPGAGSGTGAWTPWSYKADRIPLNHLTIARLRVGGASAPQIAKETGLAFRTVKEALKYPVLREHIAHLKLQYAEAKVDVGDRLTSLLSTGVTVLEECMKPDQSPSIRLRAALAVFNAEPSGRYAAARRPGDSAVNINVVAGRHIAELKHDARDVIDIDPETELGGTDARLDEGEGEGEEVEFDAGYKGQNQIVDRVGSERPVHDGERGDLP